MIVGAAGKLIVIVIVTADRGGLAGRADAFSRALTPTSYSWLNLVTAFGHSAQHNESPKPFIWIKTADQILETIERFCLRTLGTRHEPPRAKK